MFCFVSSSVKQINKYDMTFLEIFHVTDDNKSPGFIGKSYEITNSFRNHKKLVNEVQLLCLINPDCAESQSVIVPSWKKIKNDGFFNLLKKQF